MIAPRIATLARVWPTLTDEHRATIIRLQPRTYRAVLRLRRRTRGAA